MERLRGTRACCVRVRVSNTQAGPCELRSEAETGATPPLVSVLRADGGRDVCGGGKGQTTATAIREVEEQEMNYAPRLQKALLPGLRLQVVME